MNLQVEIYLFAFFVQPGSLWHDVLISGGHVTWLLGLYDTIRAKCSGDILWFDSPLAVSARQLIVQFCSLSGTVFPSGSSPLIILLILPI